MLCFGSEQARYLTSDTRHSSLVFTRISALHRYNNRGPPELESILPDQAHDDQEIPYSQLVSRFDNVANCRGGLVSWRRSRKAALNSILCTLESAVGVFDQDGYMNGCREGRPYPALAIFPWPSPVSRFRERTMDSRSGSFTIALVMRRDMIGICRSRTTTNEG